MSIKPAPPLSRRARIIPASPIRKLVPLAEDAKRRGIHVYHLNIGQPDIATPEEFFNAVRGFDEKVIAYKNSQGLAEFIDSMIGYYGRIGITLSKENIVITTGGSEALMFAIMAVAEPGDEVIVFEPFYTNYNGFAIMAGVTLVPIATDPESGYHLPPRHEIERHITDRTRAIMICNPNNPTGTVLTSGELELLSGLAVQHNLFVLSDEVYREFVYEGETKSMLMMEGVEDRVIVLDSLSKRYSLCGGRVGCVVSRNTELMESVLRFGQARLCTATLEQVGGAALVNTGDTYIAPMIDEYRARRDATYEELMKIPGIVCQKPSGAFYIMAKLPVDDIEAFARWMLTDFSHDSKTTMIAPGPGFYATAGKGNQEARIAYVLNTEDCRLAIQLLARGIREYNNAQGIES